MKESQGMRSARKVAVESPLPVSTAGPARNQAGP
jgi:hypothetical protein